MLLANLSAMREGLYAADSAKLQAEKGTVVGQTYLKGYARGSALRKANLSKPAYLKLMEKTASDRGLKAAEEDGVPADMRPTYAEGFVMGLHGLKSRYE
jgi:hypothetical protein